MSSLPDRSAAVALSRAAPSPSLSSSAPPTPSASALSTSLAPPASTPSVPPRPSTAFTSSSPTWTRVLGAGSIQRDFGHESATNARGDVLVAARLERIQDEGGDHHGDHHGHPEDGHDPAPSDGDDATVDLSGAELFKLEPEGKRIWTVRLRAARFLRAPSIALDDTGGAYVAGSYVPVDGALRGAREVSITKLRPDGTVEWTRPLFELPLDGGRPRVPVMRVAADPAGGACVTWIGEHRRQPAVRAVRFTSAGNVAWEHTWPVVAGEVRDPNVGLDTDGAAIVWGTFRGILSITDGVKAQSGEEARYLARVRADGRVLWAYALRVYRNTPYAMAVGSDGVIGHAYVVPPSASQAAETRSVLVMERIDAAGTPLSSVRGRLDKHSSISSLSLAPTVGGGFALAGYFSGAIRLGDADLRSITPASEAVFVAHVGREGELSGRAYQGPQLQAGLSIHGGAEGSVVLAGWLCGTMVLGTEKVTSPSDRAALFIAKLSLP